MKNKSISYEIKLFCKDNGKTIVPIGSMICMKDNKDKELNMLNYPPMSEVMIVWLGKYYSYPQKPNGNTKI